AVRCEARYWIRRGPGNGGRRLMARARRGAVNSLVTIFAPFDRNLSVIDSPYVVTLDLSSVAANLGQCIREPSQPAGFAQFAHVVPLRVIPVLQAPGGVAPDSLEMGGRIRRIEHVLVSRRHGQASEAAHDPCILDRPPVVSDIGPTSAATAAPDRQRVGGDVPQTEPPGSAHRRRQRAR